MSQHNAPLSLALARRYILVCVAALFTLTLALCFFSVIAPVPRPCSYIFREIFAAALDSISPLDLLADHDIRISIRNASGTRPALFIPEIAFELLVKKQIERLLPPALDCVDLVFHELQRVALQCELLSPELIRFPQLRQRLLQVFQNLLKSCLDPTKQHIERLLACELSFINTSHPDFIGGQLEITQKRSCDEIDQQQKQRKRKLTESRD